MDKNIHKLLGKEISDEIKYLESLTPGSDEHTAAVESLAKLYKLMIEESKSELDYKEKRAQRVMEAAQHRADAEWKQRQAEASAAEREQESRQQEEQLAEAIKERYCRLGIAAAELILPLVFYASWMKKGFRFEETGTFTSTTFRGLFNRFKPTKK